MQNTARTTGRNFARSRRPWPRLMLAAALFLALAVSLIGVPAPATVEAAVRANQDFNTLDADNEDPRGIWSDGTTMWVADAENDKLYAYNMSTKARDQDKDFNTLDAAGNGQPRGIWSDGETMWVADWADEKIYAYRMSDKAHDSDKDFDMLDEAGNSQPQGIWSDGTTMWVVDNNLIDDKVYAYRMSDKAHVATRDFDTLDADNDFPLGIWSDGATMWVADLDDTIYAYNLSTGARIADQDIDVDTLSAGDNGLPYGIWSGGGTMWVADNTDNKLYSYHHHSRADDDFDTLDAAENDNPQGIWFDGHNLMWVADLDDDKLYAYRTTTMVRVDALDFNTLAAAGNNSPRGIWSNGHTMWVADDEDDKLYAYSMASKARDPDKDIETLDGIGNNFPVGIWSDGETIWVADADDDEIFAYDLSTGLDVPSKDFTTLSAAGNNHPEGIWSDGTTMWVADADDDKAYAYSLSTTARDPEQDFHTLVAAGNGAPTGIWSDGATMWVADESEAKIYSYHGLPSGDTRLGALTVSPKDIHGFSPVGTRAYEVGVASTVAMATISATPNHAAATLAFSVPDADANAAGHQAALAAGRNAVTVTVTAEDPTATRTYTVNINRGVTGDFGWKAGDDFDTLFAAGNSEAHGIWSDDTTIWVSDLDDDSLYAYNLSTKARDPEQDFALFAHSLIPNPINLPIATPRGIWADGTTLWVADDNVDLIVAYSRSTKAHDQNKDFTTLSEAGNNSPRGIWSDDETMWVADEEDGKIYAYRMSDKARVDTRDFNTLDAAGNSDPRGIWSDGETMWVADFDDDKIYAYDLSTTARVEALDFNTLDAAGNNDPIGIWSDAETMWVVDFDDDKIYSYNMPPPLGRSDEPTLVSNFGQGDGAMGYDAGPSGTSDYLQAVSFTTGANLTGYDLDALTLALSTAGTGAAPEVSVHRDDSGAPGPKLYTLDTPEGISRLDATRRNVSFFAPDATRLQRNTTYWVVIGSSGAAVSVARTGETGEDTGNQHDWSIGDAAQQKDDSATDPAWTAQTDTLWLSVQASVNPPPLVSNLGLGTPSGWSVGPRQGVIDFRASGFTTGPNRYRLDALTLSLNLPSSGTAPVPRISLHRDSGGAPGEELFAFSNPSDFAAAITTTRGDFTFRAPAGTKPLDGRTSYWVVAGASGSRIRLARTTNLGEHPESLPGWSICDCGLGGNSLSPDPADVDLWSRFSSYTNWLSVEGEALPATLVANLDQPATPGFLFAGPSGNSQATIAVSFITGRDPGLNGLSPVYELSSLTLDVERDEFADTDPVPVVTVHGDSGGAPGPALFTLRNPSGPLPDDFEELKFNAPPGSRLAPERTYWLVIDADGGQINVRGAVPLDEDPGKQPGWSIEDSFRFRNQSNEAWSLSTGQTAAMKLEGFVFDRTRHEHLLQDLPHTKYTQGFVDATEPSTGRLDPVIDRGRYFNQADRWYLDGLSSGRRYRVEVNFGGSGVSPDVGGMIDIYDPVHRGDLWDHMRDDGRAFIEFAPASSWHADRTYLRVQSRDGQENYARNYHGPYTITLTEITGIHNRVSNMHALVSEGNTLVSDASTVRVQVGATTSDTTKDNWQATSFRTGSNEAGYDLAYVEAMLEAIEESSGDEDPQPAASVKVAIYEDNADNDVDAPKAGDPLIELERIGQITGAVAPRRDRFWAPEGADTLTASTTYWVVFKNETAGTRYTVVASGSAAQRDIHGEGWRIGDRVRTNDNADSMSTWSTTATQRAIAMEIHASVPATEETETEDTTAPVIRRDGAYVDGVDMGLTYNEDLDTSVTLPVSAFSVSVGGADRPISSVRFHDNTTVVLRLSSAVEEDDTVTVSYTPPTDMTVDRVQDVAGNAAGPLTNHAVDNRTGGGGGGGGATGQSGEAPGLPTNLAVTPHRSGVLSAAWDAPGSDPAPDGYTVQWKTAAGNWQDPDHVSESDVTTTSYLITGLVDGVEYAVRVLAIADDVDGDPTAEVTATPRETRPPEVDQSFAYFHDLYLTYDEPLDTRAALPLDAFTVTVNGEARTINSVGIWRKRTLHLFLNEAFAFGDVVTLSYTAPTNESAGRVRDVAGNAAASFTALLIDNETEQDTTPPVFSVARVFSTELAIVFNERLDEDAIPATSTFAVTVAGEAATVESVTVSRNDVVLTLAAAVEAGQAVTVGYTAPTVATESRVQDAAGNAAASFSPQTVTNRTESLDDATGQAVEAEAPGVPANLAVTPHRSGSLEAAWDAPGSGPAPDGYTVQWKTAAGDWQEPDQVSESDVTTTSYVITGLVDGVEYAVRVFATADDVDGDPTAEVTATPRETTPPQFQSAAVDGAELTLTYDEPLDIAATVSSSAFSVSVNNEARSLTGVGFGESSVLLFLSSPVAAGDTVTVDYTAPTGESEGRVQDAAGNAAASFSGEAVTNNTVVPLTASAHDVPASHDGSSTIVFELRFSEHFGISYRTLRDHAFTVTGGEVIKARRLDRPHNIRWEISVRPDANEAVTIVLPPTTDCDDDGAICTQDGRMLSNRLEITVPGPDG